MRWAPAPATPGLPRDPPSNQRRMRRDFVGWRGVWSGGWSVVVGGGRLMTVTRCWRGFLGGLVVVVVGVGVGVGVGVVVDD